MPLQVRRGTKAELNALTQPLANGELVWVTDEKKLYIGDGTTPAASLTPASGYNGEDAQDAAAALLTNGVHVGISFDYQDNLNRINATVDPSAFSGVITATGFKGNVLASDDSILVNSTTKEIFGSFRGDFKGSIFADDSSILVDATDGVLRGTLIGNLEGNVTGNLVGDIKGSVFGDDSTIIVDSVANLINVESIVSPFNFLNIGTPDQPTFSNFHSSDPLRFGEFFAIADSANPIVLNLNISGGDFINPAENSTPLAIHAGINMTTWVNGAYVPQTLMFTRNAYNSNYLSLAPASDFIIQVNNNTEYNYLTLNQDGVLNATGGIQAAVYVNGLSYTGEVFTQLNGRPEPTPSITNGLTGTIIFDSDLNILKVFTNDSDGAGTVGFTPIQGYNPIARTYTQTTPSDTRPIQASFTGSISGTTLTVTAVSAGYVRIGMLVTGAGVAADTYILSSTATPGEYLVNNSQTVGSVSMSGPVVDPGTIIFVSDATSGNKFQGWDGSSWVSLG